MVSRKQKNKRSSYFVKRDYQLKFILKFCLLLLAGGLVSSCLLLLFSRGTLTSSFNHSRLAIETTPLAILPAVILTNIITFVLISLACVAVVLFVSHKIAGPLFRFEKEIGAIGGGDLTKIITLRRKDQITDVAEVLNKMTADLHDKVASLDAAMEQVVESAIEREIPEWIVEDLKKYRSDMHRHFTIRRQQ
jgi:methyl-accepting chemotaxis protein